MTAPIQRTDSDERILPTHTCFEDAWRFMLIFNDPAERDQCRVAHGIMTGATPDILIAHAWIEVSDNSKDILTSGIYQGRLVYPSVERELYYKSAGLRDVRLYSFVELVALQLIHGTYGPYEPALVGLINERARDPQAVEFVSPWKSTGGIAQPAEVADRSTDELSQEDPEAMIVAGLFLHGRVRVAEIITLMNSVKEWPPTKKEFHYNGGV